MSVLTSLLDIFYPPVCLLCGGRAKTERVLCGECYAKFIRETFDSCPRCGEGVRKCVCGCDFHEHTRFRLGDRGHLSLLFYHSSRTLSPDTERVSEQMLLRLKSTAQFADFYASLLEREIRTTFAACGAELASWILTYPPRSTIKYRLHGFDQDEEIVRRLADRLGIPYRTTFLRSGGMEQKTLNAEERLENAEDSLVFLPESVSAGDKFLLFDDIITTGATISTAAKHLYFGGAAAVFPVSIARTIPAADISTETEETV